MSKNSKSYMKSSGLKAPKVKRAEFIDFDTNTDMVVDTDIISRESVSVCPFGEGLVCSTPGCMVCDDGGARCCIPGETCEFQGKTNWCTAFLGVPGGLHGAPASASTTVSDPAAVKASLSFWER